MTFYLINCSAHVLQILRSQRTALHEYQEVRLRVLYIKKFKLRYPVTWHSGYQDIRYLPPIFLLRRTQISFMISLPRSELPGQCISLYFDINPIDTEDSHNPSITPSIFKSEAAYRLQLVINPLANKCKKAVLQYMAIVLNRLVSERVTPIPSR